MELACLKSYRSVAFVHYQPIYCFIPAVFSSEVAKSEAKLFFRKAGRLSLKCILFTAVFVMSDS